VRQAPYRVPGAADVRLARAVASAAESVLSLACWLAPGSRCPRLLGAVLGGVAVLGILGVVVYALGS
jgi:hypothetical protein